MSNIPNAHTTKFKCQKSHCLRLNCLTCFLPCCAVNKTIHICLQNTEFCLDLRPPMDFHLRTSTWYGISLGFAGEEKKLKTNLCRKMPKEFFPHQKILPISGWRVIKWIATFVFGKNFLASPRTKVWIESQRRATSEAYPARPNSLIASKKQLFTSHAGTTFTPDVKVVIS